MTDPKASRLTKYLASLEGKAPEPATTACLAALDHVASVSPSVADAIVKELTDQRQSLKLIASENYSSLAVQLAQGNWFTDKYAEGYAGHRFYAGCDNVDVVEQEAGDLACQLFGAEHAYVQPHSGADANMVAFSAILAATVQTPMLEKFGEKNLAKLTDQQWAEVRSELMGQRLLGLDYYSGGHLTHGYRYNISGQIFEAHSYSVNPETGLVDLDQLHAQVKELKPRILLAGYSAYPRKLNFAKMRQMADDVGATFMVDMAHFAGLVAGKVFTGDYNPVAHAHIVTSTTHKTLRGPRGGIVLCNGDYAEFVDKGCPAVLGGPLPHVICAKAVAFREALSPDFGDYARRIVENSQALAEACQEQGMQVLTGGTDNHLLLVDVSKSFSLTGRQAESALRQCGVTLNRNSLPEDPNGPWYTSGLRFGTPATTTLGMGSEQMREIAAIVKLVLSNTKAGTTAKGTPSPAKFELEDSIVDQAQSRVTALLADHPLYPELGALS